MSCSTIFNSFQRVKWQSSHFVCALFSFGLVSYRFCFSKLVVCNNFRMLMKLQSSWWRSSFLYVCAFWRFGPISYMFCFLKLVVCTTIFMHYWSFRILGCDPLLICLRYPKLWSNLIHFFLFKVSCMWCVSCILETSKFFVMIFSHLVYNL
jgi:hypothetical protein